MHQKLISFLCFSLLIGGVLTAQMAIYDQDYFVKPVNHGLKISGSFAELRPDHFHMGIDIKSSKGASGDPILAAADGFVSRIKVQSRSYGNTIYIDHPNGYTTVYAHLSSFHPDLAKFVIENQYKAQKFEVDLYPPKGKFSFKKSEEIGRMGNSGRSFGPHLHFEIRETETEIPVNPFLFGIKPSDSKKPDLRKILVYQMKPNSTSGQRFDFPLIDTKSLQKTVKGGIVEVPGDKVALGIEAYDYMDGASNRNGLYHLDVKVEGKSVYSFTMNKLSFDEMRYLNAHIDYAERKNTKKYFQKCYIQGGNPLNIYHNSDRSAVIDLSDGRTQKVNIRAVDIEGNESLVAFEIKKGKKQADFPSSVFNFYLKFDEPNTLKHNGLKLDFKEQSIYEDLELYFSRSKSNDPSFVSEIYHIHNESVPVHFPYQVELDISDYPDSIRPYLCIAVLKEDDVLSYGGNITGNFLSAPIRQFGSIGVYIDRIAPEIEAVNFQKDMTKRSNIKFRIKDNLETKGSAKGLRYNGWIDEEWVLFEYDEKNDLLRHNFENNLESGKHLLHLEIIDDRGNKNTFITEFFK